MTRKTKNPSAKALPRTGAGNRKLHILGIAASTGDSPYIVAKRLYGERFAENNFRAKADVSGVTAPDIDSNFAESQYAYATLYFAALGQLDPVRVPFKTPISGVDGNVVGYEVEEGKSIPLSAPSLDVFNMVRRVFAALVAASSEYLAKPQGRAIIDKLMLPATAKVLDASAFHTSSPGSLLSGIAPEPWGGSLQTLEYDVFAARSSMTDVDDRTIRVLLNPLTAFALSLVRNQFGFRVFQELGANGGRLGGYEALVSPGIDPSIIVIVDGAQVLLALDPSEFSASSSATLELSDSPTGALKQPTGHSQKPLSMFQADAVALKVVTHADFRMRQSSGIAYVSELDTSSIMTT